MILKAVQQLCFNALCFIILSDPVRIRYSVNKYICSGLCLSYKPSHISMHSNNTTSAFAFNTHIRIFVLLLFHKTRQRTTVRARSPNQFVQILEIHIRVHKCEITAHRLNYIIGPKVC